jgi:hypothetical protein
VDLDHPGAIVLQTDDIMIGFEKVTDSGLPDKSRMIRVWPLRGGPAHPARAWQTRRSRRGRFALKRKNCGDRMRTKLKEIKTRCDHLGKVAQHAGWWLTPERSRCSAVERRRRLMSTNTLMSQFKK